MHKIEQLLSDINGASFIGLDIETTPKLSGGKGNPMQGAVRKVQIGNNVMVFTNKNGSAYANMVKRRLVAEGKPASDFELSPRTWGERVTGTPFITHKGELYLEVIYLKAGEVTFKHGVRDIAREEIVGLQEPMEASQGGLEDKVIIRTVKVSNIKRLVVDKTVHTF